MESLRKGFLFFYLSLVLSGVLGSAALAVSTDSSSSTSPYIDDLKKEIQDADASVDQSAVTPGGRVDAQHPEEFINSVRQELNKPEEGEPEGSYTEYLQRTDPKKNEEHFGSTKFLEDEKSRLGSLHEGGAIQAVLDNNSELKARKRGDIHHAVGLRYVVNSNRSFSGSAAERSFESVYGGSYAPEFSLFWEYQPWHSEWFGNLGIIAMGGVGYYRGYGQFSFKIPTMQTGVYFDQVSSTKFSFIAVPVTLGLIYRFNLFRILRPYIMAGPTGTLYFETREDAVTGHRGWAKSFTTAVGVSILLDWLNPTGTWENYAILGMQHLYLTVDYTRMFAFDSPIEFSGSGITAGLTFEY